jgi:nitrate/nitrite-specific signal transduction histidine kinase
MHSLLAVPIVSAGRILGNLYLAEKQGAPEFSADDEETLIRLATQAALAIANARLHRQVRELAIAEERDRIAREMHDSLAQVLGYVITKGQAVQELLKRQQTEKASGHVEQLTDAARAAYADVREGILALRTSVGQGRPLKDALDEYLQRWKEQSEIDVHLTVDSHPALAGLPPSAELQLLRIIQEALANVRKHAGAQHVDILVRNIDHTTLETVIADDGHGFDPAYVRPEGDLQPHFGLSTMRERAESVGGRLEVISAPGEGTRVVVRVPYAWTRFGNSVIGDM